MTPFADALHRQQHVRRGIWVVDCVLCARERGSESPMLREPEWKRRSKEAVAARGYVAVKATEPA